tara:strand:- start:247 stop:444 length:198 start_codon:yes stop_codon:yes gene_type:complete
MKSCPKCKSNMIIDIVYGFPTKRMLEEASSNKINLGGIDSDINSCEFKCKSCGYEFKGFEKFFKK